ncbi:MAG: SOS response-associated peptidase [Bacteroidales bacterium]|jgi:putative SOS response-associated peptidase YedK|nr:SOS response-associated peptidase [Bacteroidales bacterium]
MCGRFILVQRLEAIEKRFQVEALADFPLEPNYNVAPGQYTAIISSAEPRKLQLMRFGLTPFWAKKDMLIINARAEGDHNKENRADFSGAKGIIEKPSFRKPIRSQRCLVIADAFIEGTTNEKLSKPYLVYLRNKVRPFAMAGIYDTWIHPVSGLEISSFAIVTTTANSLMQKIPHHRSPVILSPSSEKKWLNTDAPLSDITRLLKPYDAELMNAYPIAATIKSPSATGPSLIQPTGPPLEIEIEYKNTQYLTKKGMGNPKTSFHDHGEETLLK